MIFLPFFKWDVSYVTGANGTKFECLSAALSWSVCQGKKKKQRGKGHLRLGRNFTYEVWENKLFPSCTMEKLKGSTEDLSNCYHKSELRPLKTDYKSLIQSPYHGLSWCRLTPNKWFSPLQGWCLMFPIAVEWRIKSKNGSTSQEYRWVGRKNFLLVEGIKQWNGVLRIKSARVSAASSGRPGVG